MAKYGRGTFEPAKSYIDYMHTIAEHPSYARMPNATSDGRVNWQVSSGRSTSFNEYYQPRWDWWAATADRLGLPGSGNENERFTIAARRIHPSGHRPCRLCGLERNVGYFYLNATLAKRLNRQTGGSRFSKLMPIDSAIEELGESSEALLRPLFPERESFFAEFGFGAAAFEASNYLRTSRLSPGFMGNPPDRLDGFHDYCVYCRADNDPGRSAENLRTYAHDRRAFEYWAEGDWALADALYNSAGPGICAVCGREVQKVSPDHVGPLACGFKQQPLFLPTCQPCNSAKNRRMRLSDVQHLIAYEERTGESVVSWHVRGLWDANKTGVTDDASAAELSAIMRALQDLYLRCLYALAYEDRVRFLITLLGPEYAYYSHEFIGLDPATLQFDEVISTFTRTTGRESLARRSVRIALDELNAYARKELSDRKLRALFESSVEPLIEELLTVAASRPFTRADKRWALVASPDGLRPEAREAEVGDLLELESPDLEGDDILRKLLESRLEEIGSAVVLSDHQP